MPIGQEKDTRCPEWAHIKHFCYTEDDGIFRTNGMVRETRAGYEYRNKTIVMVYPCE